VLFGGAKCLLNVEQPDVSVVLLWSLSKVGEIFFLQKLDTLRRSVVVFVCMEEIHKVQ